MRFALILILLTGCAEIIGIEDFDFELASPEASCCPLLPSAGEDATVACFRDFVEPGTCGVLNCAAWSSDLVCVEDER